MLFSVYNNYYIILCRSNKSTTIVALVNKLGKRRKFWFIEKPCCKNKLEDKTEHNLNTKKKRYFSTVCTRGSTYK